MTWGRANQGWRRANSGPRASIIADGATVEGDLTVPNGSEIIVAAGGFISLPDQVKSGGLIAAPAIRSASDTDIGLAYDDDLTQLVVTQQGGAPQQAAAAEAGADQAIAAASDTVSHSSWAPVVTKKLDNTSGGSLTISSNPFIAAGKFVGQLLRLQGGTNNIVIPAGNGNGIVTIGAASITIGPTDVVLLHWQNARWEQLAAVATL